MDVFSVPSFVSSGRNSMKASSRCQIEAILSKQAGDTNASTGWENTPAGMKYTTVTYVRLLVQFGLS